MLDSPVNTEVASDFDEGSHRAQVREIPYANFGTPLGGDYPPCPKDILHHGHVVCVSLLSKEQVEGIVRVLQEEWTVDWHWKSSRPVIKALEDLDTVPLIRARYESLAGEAVSAWRKEIDRISQRNRTIGQVNKY